MTTAFEGTSAPPLTRFRLHLIEENHGLFAAQPAPVTKPAAAAHLLWPLVFEGEPREVMAVLFLDTLNQPIGYQVAFTGTLNRSLAEPRHILVSALLCNAANFLVAHNHPSGEVSPSVEDLDFTHRLKKAAEPLGVCMLDHLILASHRGKLRFRSLLRRSAW